MTLEPGSLIDEKYRVIRRIGEGGMGAVYHGENTRIRRQVAIKVLHAQVAQDAEVVQRFEREAQAAGCIGNDHILEVLDLGVLPSGDRYIVMEFLDGEPLSQRLERLKRVPPQDLAPLIGQLLDGLGAAHQAGITHRDLKPDNVFLLKKKAGHVDFVKIIDFGISKFSKADGGIKMTRSGVVMGTPLYMSPEQARTAEADPRSDLYAVGVIMYEAVAGRVPFTADQFSQLLVQIVMGEYIPLHVAAPDVDPHFAAIVTKAMARERSDRFQSAEELRAALEQWRIGAGYGRFSSVSPTVAMGHTPPPGTLAAPGVTPYPSPRGIQGTPYPAPQGMQGTPYPAPQGMQGMQGTPHPAPQGMQGMQGTPHPAPQGMQGTPYPQPRGLQGTPYPQPQGVPYATPHGLQGAPYPMGQGAMGVATPAGGSSGPTPAGGPAAATSSGADPAAGPFQGSNHAWGASQSGAPGARPPAKGTSRVVPLAIAAVLIVGVAGAFGVSRLMGGKADGRPAPTSDLPPRAEAVPPAAMPPPAASSRGEPAASVPPSTNGAPAQAADPTAVTLAPTAPAREAPPSPVPPAANTAAATGATRPSRPATPPAPAKPATDPKPAPAKPAPGKSTPDFGY